jgi:hypothetical protein
MKKILFIICLITVSLSTFAQKKYLLLNYTSSYSGRWYLCGERPDGMEEYYNASTSNGYGEAKVVGEILNELAERGYEVEFMPDKSHYLLSKKASDSYNAMQRVHSDDKEATEIARYNLQGIPVNEYDKGVQIIVYSNYTTKTVIVQ